MVTIETEAGKFEGNTLQEAQKLAKKAIKAHAAEQAIIRENEEIAGWKASAELLKILSIVWREGTKRGWEIVQPGNQYYGGFWVQDRMDKFFRLGYGEGRLAYFGCSITHALVSGSGFPMAVRVDYGINGGVEWYGIAEHKNTVSLSRHSIPASQLDPVFLAAKKEKED